MATFISDMIICINELDRWISSDLSFFHCQAILIESKTPKGPYVSSFLIFLPPLILFCFFLSRNGQVFFCHGPCVSVRYSKVNRCITSSVEIARLNDEMENPKLLDPVSTSLVQNPSEAASISDFTPLGQGRQKPLVLQSLGKFPKPP